MKRRANKPVSWLPASEYVARRRKPTRRCRLFGCSIELNRCRRCGRAGDYGLRGWLLLGAGVACLIAAGVLAVVTR